METLIFTGTPKETKNSYTINENLPLIFGATKPIIKKIIFGIEIKKPTSYKVYKSENSIRRVWCFNNIELNPSRYNLDLISNNNK